MADLNTDNLADRAYMQAQMGVPGVTAPYLGAVSGLGRIPTLQGGSNTASMALSTRIASVEIKRPRVLHPNWYIDLNTQAEIAATADVTITDWIEYPIGQALAATATTVVAAGATGVNDLGLLTTPIPKGAAYRIWSRRDGPLQLYNQGRGGKAVGSGILFGVAAPATPTLGALIGGANLLVDNGYFPVILDDTIQRSALLFGDSHEFGNNEISAVDMTGLYGPFERFFGPSNAWMNVGISGDTLQKFLAGSTRRQTLAPYFSDIGIGQAGGDITAGKTSAQIIADIRTAAALFPGKRVFTASEFPKTSTSDSFSTVANQTPLNKEDVRLAVNVFKRTDPTFHHCFEFEPVVSDFKSDGAIVWKAPGYTTDGVHGERLAYQAFGSLRGERFPGT